MLRDKNLVPLSRQHQHALALCVRLDRALQAGEVSPEPWQAEIQLTFEQEIAVHFAAEESAIFPVAREFPELRPVVDELIADHGILRELFARAANRTLNSPGLREFTDTLSTHIRKEERQLFEGLQKHLSLEQIAAMGKSLEEALALNSSACIAPNEATRLRPRT